LALFFEQKKIKSGFSGREKCVRPEKPDKNSRKNKSVRLFRIFFGKMKFRPKKPDKFFLSVRLFRTGFEPGCRAF
jgi:hypothetical protein